MTDIRSRLFEVERLDPPTDQATTARTAQATPVTSPPHMSAVPKSPLIISTGSAGTPSGGLRADGGSIPFSMAKM